MQRLTQRRAALLGRSSQQKNRAYRTADLGQLRSSVASRARAGRVQAEIWERQAAVLRKRAARRPGGRKQVKQAERLEARARLRRRAVSRYVRHYNKLIPKPPKTPADARKLEQQADSLKAAGRRSGDQKLLWKSVERRTQGAMREVAGLKRFSRHLSSRADRAQKSGHPGRARFYTTWAEGIAWKADRKQRIANRYYSSHARQTSSLTFADLSQQKAHEARTQTMGSLRQIQAEGGRRAPRRYQRFVDEVMSRTYSALGDDASMLNGVSGLAVQGPRGSSFAAANAAAYSPELFVVNRRLIDVGFALADAYLASPNQAALQANVKNVALWSNGFTRKPRFKRNAQNAAHRRELALSIVGTVVNHELGHVKQFQDQLGAPKQLVVPGRQGKTALRDFNRYSRNRETGADRFSQAVGLARGAVSDAAGPALMQLFLHSSDPHFTPKRRIKIGGGTLLFDSTHPASSVRYNQTMRTIHQAGRQSELAPTLPQSIRRNQLWLPSSAGARGSR